MEQKHGNGCKCIDCASRARRIEIGKTRQLAPHEARDAPPVTITYEPEQHRIKTVHIDSGTIRISDVGD